MGLNLPEHVVVHLFLNNVPFAVRSADKSYRGRCVACGDSKKNQSKKRLYLYLSSKAPHVHCFNCGYSNNAVGFFREYFPNQLRAVIKDGRTLFRKKNEDEELKKKVEDSKWKINRARFFTMCCVGLDAKTDSLLIRSVQKQAKNFCVTKGIPKKYLGEFFVCFEDSVYHTFTGRLIVPFYDDLGQIYHFQARNLYPTGDKYLTGRLTDLGIPVIYRWFTVDRSKPIFVTEGLLDCLFLDNGVSLCGAAKFSSPAILFLTGQGISDIIFVMDNDTTGLGKMKGLLKKGVRCFIPPKEFQECRDLGEYSVKSGVVGEKLSEWILTNSFSGVQGLARLR